MKTDSTHFTHSAVHPTPSTWTLFVCIIHSIHKHTKKRPFILLYSSQQTPLHFQSHNSNILSYSTAKHQTMHCKTNNALCTLICLNKLFWKHFRITVGIIQRVFRNWVYRPFTNSIQGPAAL